MTESTERDIQLESYPGAKMRNLEQMMYTPRRDRRHACRNRDFVGGNQQQSEQARGDDHP